MSEEIWDELYSLRRKANRTEQHIKELESALAHLVHNIECICITQTARLPGSLLDLVRETRQLLEKGDPK
ncbi:MAG: hypothetical protein GY832_02630 [Chloroflexi bacterium]|nr:hypothetical protein [Chloroflexota bacterium]